MQNLDRSRTALLVMDLQNDIVAMLGAAAAPLLDVTATLVAAARAAGVPVIYVVVGFRPGYPELSQNNATFSAVAKTGRFVGVGAADVAPAVAPQGNEIVVVKHRVSALHGTDLDLVLRAQGRDTLVLCGIATSGVVLSTTRAAADLDYRVVIAKDACADRDEEVNRVLLDKVLAHQATVVPAAEVVAALGGA
ncbi:MAG TPA: isochorismatase family cysteine hydrolase [Kofleriaceae bacterium]|jgi:nicotinamidase-related amidase